MRTLIQRVTRAAVHLDGQLHAEIGHGLLVLLGIAGADTNEDIAWLAPKLARLRLFPDSTGAMNRSVLETGGSILLVSQFTLFASTKKGNRPSFLRAARPEHAIPLYEAFREALALQLGKPVPAGVFGADMQVTLTNDGPVTVWIDSTARE